MKWLLAVAAPWLAYFAVAPRMHERYLLWGAAAASLAAGVSVGTTLLALAASALSWTDTARQLFWAGHTGGLSPPWSPHLGDQLATYLNGTYPDAGWALLVIAAIFVYGTVRPPDRRAARERRRARRPARGLARGRDRRPAVTPTVTPA